MIGQRAEIVASRQPGADEKEAYERVLSDGLAGDATLFARRTMSKRRGASSIQLLTANSPVREYEPGTWGPTAKEQDIAPPGGWANPTTEDGA